MLRREGEKACFCLTMLRHAKKGEKGRRKSTTKLVVLVLAEERTFPPVSSRIC